MAVTITHLPSSDGKSNRSNSNQLSTSVTYSRHITTAAPGQLISLDQSVRSKPQVGHEHHWL